MNINKNVNSLFLSLITMFILTIGVTKMEAQCPSLACMEQVNTSLPSALDCTLDITPEMLLRTVCASAVVEISGVIGTVVSSTGDYTVSVVDPLSGNRCWGTVTVEDKNPPILICPIDFTISCADPNDPVSIADSIATTATSVLYGGEYNGPANAAIWGVGVTECSDYNLEYQDQYINAGCDGDTIYRTFTATDRYGQTASCTQAIYLEPESINDLTLPSDFDCIDEAGCMDRILSYGTVTREAVLACDGAGTVWNTLANGYPSPYNSYDSDGDLEAFGTGIPSGVGTCGTIDAGYTDNIIDICGETCDQSYGSYKVIRNWTVLDWCSGSVIEHNQIIKVLDIVAPVIDTLPDVTISTDLWTCGATYILPSAPATDNCSNDISVSWTSSVGSIADGVLTVAEKTMPGADIDVYVHYSDCCNNIASDTFVLAVRDLVPPVVVVDQHTVVSLSINQNEGLSKIYVESFDDGSFDNCGSIEMSVIRLNGTCTGFKTETKYDREHYDFVHFCCKDVGKEEMMVEIQVCDDANMNGIHGSYWLPDADDPTDGERIYDEEDNCNTAMVSVEVQDKLPPACFAPDNVTVSCIDFVPFNEFVNDGELRSSDAKKVDAAFGVADGGASCDYDVEQELQGEEVCGEGEITRIIKVINDNNGQERFCEQRIYITFDEDVNFVTCDDISFPEGSQEEEIFTAYIKANYDDEDFVYPDKVWCLMNPFNVGQDVKDGENLPAIEVMDCAEVSITAPVINIVDLCSEVGMNLTLDTFNFAGGGCKKILAHWEIIDQCKFEENYLYEGEINPFVAENGYFEMYVEYDLFDTEGPVITCGEGFTVGCNEELEGAITASATDNCTDPSFFGWTWQLDIGNDGEIEHTGEGNSVSPEDLGMTSFPAGDHSIIWSVSDGCGNFGTKTCEFGLEMLDTKAPTPYCYDGLSSAVMGTDGTVTMWASDFDAGSYDDCSDVFVSIIPESDTEGMDDLDAYVASLNRIDGVYGWEFDCADIANGVSAEIEVRMYATDEEGNFDYCTATFRLNDNLDGCPDVDNSFASIGGNVSTEYEENVDQADVEAFTLNPEYPKTTQTNSSGIYAFFDNPTQIDYEISASKESKYLENVSTLDLIIIQKHVLGIEKLDSPYKIIAANVKNDNSIKASDLLTLRKLILGLYNNDEIPNQSSWIFLPTNHEFSDPTNPFPYNEVARIDGLSSDELSTDFKAIKVGDVSYNVAGSSNINAQVRSEGELSFDISNNIYKAGETIRMDFTSANFNEVFGYQFTLDFDNKLEFIGFDKGVLELDESNFGFNKANEGIITTSYSNVSGVTANKDGVLFTLLFEAKEAINLKDNVTLNSAATQAEAYVGQELLTKDVVLNLRDGGQVVENQGFKLYQNEPNPFKGATTIGFVLPESADATLSIYDVTGKVLYKKTKAYSKGYNTELIDGIDASGVMYYQLDSEEYSATEKMIVIRK